MTLSILFFLISPIQLKLLSSECCKGSDVYLNQLKAERIRGLGKDVTPEKVEQILSMRIRSEKVAIKDIKLRTFIAEGNNRNDLAAHVYDVTYGSLQPFNNNNLVIIDDSIVRGTTLRQSIIRILNRLNPKQIVIVSSSPATTLSGLLWH